MIEQKNKNFGCVFFLILAHLFWSGCGKNSNSDRKPVGSVLDSSGDPSTSDAAAAAAQNSGGGGTDDPAGDRPGVDPGEEDPDEGEGSEDGPCFFGDSYPSSPEVLDSVELQFLPVDDFPEHLKFIVKGEEVDVTVKPIKVDVYIWKNTWSLDASEEYAARAAKIGDPSEKNPPYALRWSKLISVDLPTTSSSSPLTVTGSELSSLGVKVSEVADISFAWKLKLSASKQISYQKTADEPSPYRVYKRGSSEKYVGRWFRHFFKTVRVDLNGKNKPYVLSARRFFQDNIGGLQIKQYTETHNELHLLVEHLWTENWVLPSGSTKSVEELSVPLQRQWNSRKKNCDRLSGS